MIALSVLMILTLAACGSKTETPAAGGEEEKADDSIKIAVLIPFAGDQSYFDTIAKGGKAIDGTTINGKKVVCDVFECDPDGAAEQTNWENWYANVCEDSDYDLVVGGNSSYEAFLWAACEKYPDQMFMNFDMSAAPASGIPSNCYAVTYALDDLGYVVGTLSASLTKTGVVGVVVGMENQAMNQFISGYCQVVADMGKQYVIDYPGSFTDTALGKEHTEAMIAKNADVIWQVAGGLGNGVIEACASNPDVWCVGVDQDQYAGFASTNEAWANTIITSALKKADFVLAQVANMVADGSFSAKLGTSEQWGISMGGVGIVENDYYKANVPAEIQTAVADTLAKVTAGEVEIIDCMEWSAEEYEANWAAVRDAARVQ